MQVREGSLEAPTRHPLDWKSADFWDVESLQKEMERVFDICHGCRRCVSLCGAFPTLFDLVDNGPTMEVDGVPKERYKDVVDQCYLCDMCYMSKCPYVPPHPWNLDFPHLMLRAKSVVIQTRRRAGNRPFPHVDRQGRHVRRHPHRHPDHQRGQSDGAGTGGDGNDDGHGPHRMAARFRDEEVPLGGASESDGAGRRRCEKRPARSPFSRPATSTTTSRASATIWSAFSSTTRIPVDARGKGSVLRHARSSKSATSMPSSA
jgi:ferredoxin